MEDAYDDMNRKMAQRGADLLRKEIVQGKPATGEWEDDPSLPYAIDTVAELTAAEKGFSTPYGLRSGSLYNSVYMRQEGDNWVFGLDHPAALAFEFGYDYDLSSKASAFLYYNLETRPHYLPGRPMRIPARPLMAPVNAQLDTESQAFYDATVGFLERMARP